MLSRLVVLVVVLTTSTVIAIERRGLGIDTTDQDIQNLVAMLKRNGFTDAGELQRALEVLRPEKFKGSKDIGGTRTRRQGPASPQAAPIAESSVLAAPPVVATSDSIAQAPIAPQPPTHQHQLQGGIIAAHGVGPALDRAIGQSPGDLFSTPSSSSSSSSTSSINNEEEANENESRGVLSGVVHRVASLFSASE